MERDSDLRQGAALPDPGGPARSRGYDAGNNITALFANRCVLKALTGTAMRRLGLIQPDYADPRSLGHNGIHSHPNRP